jgi:hypothetical protein
MSLVFEHATFTVREDAAYSAKHATQVPKAAAWFGHIGESRGIEHLAVLSADN